ncbi:uncharacterized protein LOC128404262 [Podarcis raffonei]|uniref:uncharacterized protein LOC128404262 n=1 Tax=Podarcis raffonei TaxID=65483 RepID=UPI0023290EB7|nr:uncharacterized protein LOC128404262 [Podarcis raffonei]
MVFENEGCLSLNHQPPKMYCYEQQCKQPCLPPPICQQNTGIKGTKGLLRYFFPVTPSDFVSAPDLVHMGDAAPGLPLNFSHRYRRASQKVPYYGYTSGRPLPPFVSKRLPRSGSQYYPFYGSRYPAYKTLPPRGKVPCAQLYSPPGVTGYQPRGATVYPDPHTARYSKLNKNPTLPHTAIYQKPLPTQCPYSGMTKGRHGPINKGSLPCVTGAPLPRVTKGPVMYPTNVSQPCLNKAPLPRMTKGPVLYSSKDLLPHIHEPPPRLAKGPLPRMTKGPVFYATEDPQPGLGNASQANVTKGTQPHPAKGTLPRATKGPRLVVTKVPRFSALRASRYFLKRASRPNLTRGSQPSLVKGSRPSLAKGSRVSLTKGSQPSLVRNTTNLAASKKLPKNVKIASTGKKYCSATKWPF